MRPPIHSQKHYVQWTLSTVAAGAAGSEQIMGAVTILSKNLPTEIAEGAVVKAVYIELWADSSSADGSQIVVVSKDASNGQGPTFAQAVALDSYDIKKNILFTHQGLSANDGVGNPALVMRGWIKIPKSKQRFGLGDTLFLTIANPSSNTLTYCGFATYKEYL